MTSTLDLVFEGGGAKGIAFSGALQELEARKIRIGRLMGTSAGAISATLLAAGYRSADVARIVTEKLPNGSPRFATFMDVPASFDEKTINKSLSRTLFDSIDVPFVPKKYEERIDKEIINRLMTLPAYRQLFSFVERGGLFAGDKFREWLGEKLDAGGRGLSAANMADFNRMTGKDLSVVASDTIGQEMLVLNHRTAPKLPVVWAVRMSMSLPFLWQEVRWDPAWGLYRGRDLTGHTIVDGGALSNFPIEYFLGNSPEIRRVMGATSGPRHVLGLLIDETLPVPGSVEVRSGTAKRKKKGLDEEWLVVVNRIGALINTLTSARDNVALRTYAKNICRLPAKGYGTTEFGMSENRVKALVRAGRTATRLYFDAQI